jgi:hypothetical protein
MASAAPRCLVFRAARVMCQPCSLRDLVFLKELYELIPPESNGVVCVKFSKKEVR